VRRRILLARRPFSGTCLTLLLLLSGSLPSLHAFLPALNLAHVRL